MTTRLLQVVDEFVKKINPTDAALLKICSVAFGLFLGASVSGGGRKAVRNIGLIAFIATLFPLAWKFYEIFKSTETVVISDETNI